jgi:hypothetical protein
VLSAIGSPLVAGSSASAMELQFIRVLRAFYVGNNVLAVGAIVEVPRHVAAGAIAAGKAEATEKPAPVIVEEPVEAVAPEVTVEDPVPQKRGKKHARE